MYSCRYKLLLLICSHKICHILISQVIVLVSCTSDYRGASRGYYYFVSRYYYYLRTSSDMVSFVYYIFVDILRPSELSLHLNESINSFLLTDQSMFFLFTTHLLCFLQTQLTIFLFIYYHYYKISPYSSDHIIFLGV